jgi:sugar lactone lactonase YvrE
MTSRSSSQSNFASLAQGKRSRRSLALTTAIFCGLSLAAACSDDDDKDPIGNTGGSGGGAGAAGTGGTAGGGGTAGTAGNGGNGGTAGTAGSGGQNGPDGTVTVLNADAAALNGPTTAAIRDTNLWVVNGQLSTLGGTPALPFNVVSVPLAGGAVGATSIVLPGGNFFPEGIAAAADGTLYVGSVTLGSIVRIPAGSTTPDADEFVEVGVAQRGVIGLTVDAARSLLWFCDSSPTLNSGGDLVGVALATGLETIRHAMPNRASVAAADAGADAGDAGAGAAPAPTFCNDVVVDGGGNVFATDSSGRVFRVPAASFNVANSAAVWLDDPAITTPGGFGANGLDLVAGHLIIAANGRLVSVDAASSTPASTLRVLNLTEAGAAVTLCGPDGLQAVPNTNDIVVVENGSCATPRERVVRVTLDLD